MAAYHSFSRLGLGWERYGMVLGPPLAVFLLDKSSHFRRAHYRTRRGLSGGKCACDKAAHCTDSGMEEETFPTMILDAFLGHNVFSGTGTYRMVASRGFRGPG